MKWHIRALIRALWKIKFKSLLKNLQSAISFRALWKMKFKSLLKNSQSAISFLQNEISIHKIALFEMK